MPDVKGVACAIITGKLAAARTNGDVYLGLGGREFALNAPNPINDFEFGSEYSYIFGVVDKAKLRATKDGNGKVAKPEWNDLTKGLVLDSDELRNLPKYIRFEPEGEDDEWHLAYADVRIFFDMDREGRKVPMALGFKVPDKRFTGLWLSKASGKVAYLSQEFTF